MGRYLKLCSICMPVWALDSSINTTVWKHQCTIWLSAFKMVSTCKLRKRLTKRTTKVLHRWQNIKRQLQETCIALKLWNQQHQSPRKVPTDIHKHKKEILGRNRHKIVETLMLRRLEIQDNQRQDPSSTFRSIKDNRMQFQEGIQTNLRHLLVCTLWVACILNSKHNQS